MTDIADDGVEDCGLDLCYWTSGYGIHYSMNITYELETYID